MPVGIAISENSRNEENEFPQEKYIKYRAKVRKNVTLWKRSCKDIPHSYWHIR